MPQQRTSIPDSPGAAFYRTLVDRCARGIIDAVGEGDVEALLLIGAPARGEPTVVETGAGPYSLSDVDIACIGRPEADAAALRRRLARWVKAANEELAPVCSGVDASLRLRGDLRDFRPLIATFEMLRTPTLVWGDASVLDELPHLAVEDVPAWDSLTLLHNRMVEGALLHRRVARAARDVREALSALYATGKVTLDAVTAFLFLESDVPERYVDRARAFGERILDRPDSDTLVAGLMPHLPDIEAFARFKASGDIAGLAETFGAEASAEGLTTLASRCLRGHAGLVETLWRLALERVSGGDARGGLGSVAALYSRLETLPRKVVRAARILRSPAGRSGLFSARRVVALAPFASPKQLAYLTAAVAYLEMSDRARGDDAWPIVRRYCPFDLPDGFWSSEGGARRETLLDRLGLFLRVVLHGREVTPEP